MDLRGGAGGPLPDLDEQWMGAVNPSVPRLLAYPRLEAPRLPVNRCRAPVPVREEASADPVLSAAAPFGPTAVVEDGRPWLGVARCARPHQRSTRGRTTNRLHCAKIVMRDL